MNFQPTKYEDWGCSLALGQSPALACERPWVHPAFASPQKFMQSLQSENKLSAVDRVVHTKHTTIRQ